jgi:signal transduction histidine kinase/ligand-binding sensor domain-containing protein/DNA-binding response OmpR family regulator
MNLKHASIKYFIFCALMLCFCHLAAGQYRIRKIGIEQGLSSNYVGSITQDKEGFLWFGTESGLNRFDGHTFTVYKKSQTNSINSNELNMVLADRTEDIIWIATQRSGLNAFNYKTNTFQYYTHDQKDTNSIVTDDVTCIANAADGNLWLSTYTRGFEYFDKKTKRFTHHLTRTLPGLVNNMIWCIADDQKGALYIGHVNNGLSVMSLKSGKIKNYFHDGSNPYSIPSNEVLSIFIGKTNDIWIGTTNGLALFNPEAEKFIVSKTIQRSASSYSRNIVYTIIELNDNKLLFGANNTGANILDLRQATFMGFENAPFQKIPVKDDESGLSNPFVRAAFQDSYGNIWLGTYGGGINFISNRSDFFKTWTYSSVPGIENSLSSKSILAICTDNKDRLWVCTERGGIDLFERGTKIKNYSKNTGELQDNIVRAALKDSKGNLWFGTSENGLVYYDMKTGQFKKVILYPRNVSRIFCLYEDLDNNIWIGASDGLYYNNLKSGKSGFFNKENSALKDNEIRAIRQGSDGNIWVGTYGQGIFVFNRRMKVLRVFNTNNGFPSNGISHIYNDSKGRIWVGTWDGLVLFKSANDTLCRVYNEKDGLADGNIRAITEGVSDKLWISTSSGISSFDINNGQFKNFNHNDGLPIGIFMNGSVAKTADGTIYFGSQNGVSYFNPNHESSSFKIPQPTITDFKIYDKHIAQTNYAISIPVAKTIKLNYKQNTFSILFNVMDYALNNQVEFSYSLKGLDDQWYQVNNENQVTYRNIPPGKYKFMVKARMRNHDWPKEATSVLITIAPPLWLTWWAKGIYVLIFVGLIIYIIRFYKKRINIENALIWEKKSHQQEQELNNERLGFYTNITHELRTPLTLIIGPLEDLEQNSEMSQKDIKKISLIHRSAIRLLELINQLLEFRKTETQNRHLCVALDDISSLIHETGLKYKELNQSPSIVFNINIEAKNQKMYFDREVITMIVDNLVSNAIKNTEKGEITLSLRNTMVEETSYTEIEVRDTGRGIPDEALSKIFDHYYQVKDGRQVSGSGIGLSLVKNLVALHQGIVTVKSAVNEGSSFCVKLITNNTYPDATHINTGEKNSQENEVTSDDRKLILIIEDNNDIRDYIASSLSGLYETMVAENGAVGLELALAHTPDVIISDIMMPSMDGYELCKTLKADMRTSHVPVILLTAKDTLQDKTEGYAIGADSYITKPFSATLIQNRIANLLESRRKIAELFSSSLGQKRAQITESLSKLDTEFIDKVVSIIEENLESEKTNVVSIAEQMNMSHSSLYRKIKSLTGLTINEFSRKIKIRNAERLLLTGKYSISEIAFKVGIESVDYFRQCFKEEFGLTPSEYINQVKPKKG